MLTRNQIIRRNALQVGLGELDGHLLAGQLLVDSGESVDLQKKGLLTLIVCLELD